MENKKISLWKQSKPYLAGLQFALLIAFLATIASNIITVYGPTRIKEMTNIIASGLETSVDVAAVAAIGGFFSRDLCDWASIKLFAGLSIYNSNSTFFRAFENSHCREN